MISYRMLAALGVTIAVAGSLSACASQVRLSGKSMCEAHGGTYASGTKQCSYPAQPPSRSALQICQMHGGEWDDVSDTCAVNNRTK